MDRQKVFDEWMTAIDAEVARRTKEKEKQVSVASTKLLDQLEQMGERLLAGPAITELVTELMAAKGDRKQIEAICQRRDMSRMEACAPILQYDAKTAVDLRPSYACRAYINCCYMRATPQNR